MNNIIDIGINLDKKKKNRSKKLYQMAFFDILINGSKKISKKNYQIVLNSFLPILAYKFLESNFEQAKTLIVKYSEIRQDDASFLVGLGDDASALTYILTYYFNQFYIEMCDSNFEQTLKKNIDFYEQMEECFNLVPVAYLFALINNYELLSTKNNNYTGKE